MLPNYFSEMKLFFKEIIILFSFTLLDHDTTTSLCRHNDFEPILSALKVQSGNEHSLRQTHRLTKNFDAKSFFYCGNAGTFTFV